MVYEDEDEKVKSTYIGDFVVSEKIRTYGGKRGMNIKLLVCYHKPAELLKDEIMTPIHVGRALAKKRMDQKSDSYKWLMDNLIGDDTGDNISEKNGSYNEMTALYWAWKNYEQLGNPDYVGLMHYRRHFILRDGEIDVVNFDDMNEHYFEEINYSVEQMKAFIDGCDYVAHIGKVKNVYQHYIENHRKEDIDLAFEILYEKYPEYKQIAKEYFAGDLSNFCNMFIFSKKIFFEYCEWIFDILAEFERRVDLTEKRLFISERLTGVFIAKLMKDKALKHKIVPIAFVDEPAKIPVIMPYKAEEQYAIATTIVSMLKNKKECTKYDIKLVSRKEASLEEKEKFEFLQKYYGNCNIEFHVLDVEQEYYPIYISEMFKDINKCIYMSEKNIVLKDLSEFFRICSVDDYYAVGVEKEGKCSTVFLVLNCKLLRSHGITQKAQHEIVKGEDATELWNMLLKGQLGYIPPYLITVESYLELKGILNNLKSRGQYQFETTWTPIILFDEKTPWENPQGVLSLYWWENVSSVPSMFGFVNYVEEKLVNNLNENQKEINKENVKKENRTGKKVYYTWDSYPLWMKVKIYCNNHGVKQTVKHAFEQIVGGAV